MRPSEVTRTWTDSRRVCRLFRNAVEKAVRSSIVPTLRIQFPRPCEFIALENGEETVFKMQPAPLGFLQLCDYDDSRAIFRLDMNKFATEDLCRDCEAEYTRVCLGAEGLPYTMAMYRVVRFCLGCLSETTIGPMPPSLYPLVTSICATILPSPIEFDVDAAELQLSLAWKPAVCKYLREERVIAEALAKIASKDVEIGLRSKNAKSRKEVGMLLALSSAPCRRARFDKDLVEAIYYRNRCRLVARGSDIPDDTGHAEPEYVGDWGYGIRYEIRYGGSYDFRHPVYDVLVADLKNLWYHE